MEHNAVWRSLRALERRGEIEISTIAHAADGIMMFDEVSQLIRDNTRLLVSTHASNVSGTLMPIRRLGRLAAEDEIFFMVDAAQTAGSYPIDVDELKVDILVFTGHKGLMGPQGTGGFYLPAGDKLPAGAVRWYRQRVPSGSPARSTARSVRSRSS